MVRRLPVLNSPEPDGVADRPRWQWVLIGGGFVLTLFLPLSLLGLWLGGALARAVRGNASLRLLVGAMPVAIAFIVACMAAGVLVGRFGGRARVREAVGSGLLGALLCWGASLLGHSLPALRLALWSLLVLVLLALPAAALGGRLGLRGRGRG